MNGFPSFDEWYQAINGRSPFPWQSRLARRLAADEGWPNEIGVQTGLGKTTCLDIAIWWLASQATRSAAERTAPTRIWWLVNRRLLVDATADHAESIAGRLADGEEEEPAIRSVAEHLRLLSASSSGNPLEVVKLRGGADVGRPTDPSQPVVVLSTIPMYGSRLLFRGYGSSRSMRPIDAALAGTDALVLVDEAHLARHLMDLFDPLAACDRSTADVLPPDRRRPTVVSLTATGSAEADRFVLADADLAHLEVQKRLHAAKPLRIVESAKKDNGAKLLARQAVSALDASEELTSCVVFVNSPAMAREVAEALSATPPERSATVYVATGRQRGHEAQLIRKAILDPASGIRSRTQPSHPTDPASAPSPTIGSTRQRHLVVVATQTLEVGADLDFDHLVTEACGVRALTQRLGRLNRLGDNHAATATYVHLPPPSGRQGDEKSWPVYGTEPAHVLERLRGALEDDGTISMSPAVVSDVLGLPEEDRGRAPEVMPELLWEWAKTTNPPWGEAPVEPYFSGLSDPARMVTVCWRAWLPDLPPPEADSPVPPRIWPRVSAIETIDVPVNEVRDALRPSATPPDEVVRVWVISADRANLVPADVTRLRPGTTVVLPSSVGLYDKDGWSPTSRLPVPDVVLQHHGLPLDVDLLTSGLGDMRSTQAKEAAEQIRDAIRSLASEEEDAEDLEATNDALNDLYKALKTGGPPPTMIVERDEQEDGTDDLDPWQTFLDRLRKTNGLVRSPDGSMRLARKRATSQMRIDELDELSAEAKEAAHLDSHGRDVGRRAANIADRIGLLGVSATVSMAGEFHDLGKADDRFQRWLDPEHKVAEGRLLAKSTDSVTDWQATRARSGWPRGGRHEALSARLVAAWIASGAADEHPEVDLDLLVHLVVSHHGHARPFLVPVASPDRLGSTVSALVRGHEVSSSADLSVADWDQPARFRRLSERYGHWGLALLEAMVRQADHAVSSANWATKTTEVA